MKLDRREFFKYIAWVPFVPSSFLRQSLSSVDMMEVWASDSPDIRVWLEDVEVSGICTGAYVPTAPNTLAEGWCELFTQDPPIMGSNFGPATEKKHGLVKWQHADKAI